MDVPELIILGWIAIVVVVWLIIRRKRPGTVGLDNDRNKQKLDGMRLAQCQLCNQGVMEPKFLWWRYFFTLWIPLGRVYVIGRPDEYRSTACNHVENPERKGGIITRVSLSQHFPLAFVVSQIVLFVLWFFILVLVIAPILLPSL